MAEFLIAAQNMPSGYKRGDPIVVKPDDWIWGRAEGLPNFWVVAVAGVLTGNAEPYVRELWEPAQSGDPEFDNPDPADRRIQRHRRRMRIIWGEMPAAWITSVEATGRLELTKAQAKPYFRRLDYNRGTSQIVETSEEIIS